MWNKCNVVMLSTKEKTDILLTHNGLFCTKHATMFLTLDKNYKHQHLYITSNEEIKEGELVLLPNKEIHRMTPSDMISYLDSQSKATKKIIATTDISLELPLIPQQFINAFIEQYNEGNVIKETLVEYEEYEKDEEWSKLRLKVNLNGVINIKFPKDNFSREEVIELLHKYETDMTYFGRDSYYKGCFPEVTDDWANENL